jgi:hypothetical protein
MEARPLFPSIPGWQQSELSSGLAKSGARVHAYQRAPTHASAADCMLAAHDIDVL